MPASFRFTQLTLRTTDAPAAASFYESVLGRVPREIFPLHEQAVARGARPHWLGQIEVDDVEQTATAFAAYGAMRLGPTNTFPGGRCFAVLRDPGGAIVGLTSPSAITTADAVVWHQLNTESPEAVIRCYAELCHFQMTEREQHPEHGAIQYFTWSGASENVGAFNDITGREGRHPHWLFQFRVADLDRSITVVRAQGGLVLGPFAWPTGERVAVCDDPQGAAFALRGS